MDHSANSISGRENNKMQNISSTKRGCETPKAEVIMFASLDIFSISLDPNSGEWDTDENGES